MSFTAKTLAAGLLCVGLTACTEQRKAIKADAMLFVRANIQTNKAQCEKTSDEANAYVATATNSRRGWVGLHPVEANPKLAKAAARIACDLAKKGTQTQSSVSYETASEHIKAQGYSAKILAKNVTVGEYDLPGILEEWNNSHGHLQRILTPQLRDVGIGSVFAADGKTRIWTAVYAVEH